jgi:uncharacterized membrane protein
MPTYNTIMALAAGVGLLLVVALGWQLMTDRPIATEGWAVAFVILGAILAVTGLHMTLTWPLASGGFAFDNIIFGEPSLGFGALMLGAAIVLWRRGALFAEASREDSGLRTEQVQRLVWPISIFVFALSPTSG